MTDRATLLGLADRCEKASGPDRELDAAIVRAVAVPKIAENVHWSPIGTTRELRGRVFFNGWEDEWWPVPNYTASLDAALSLVSAGFVAAMSELAADGLPGCCICTDTSTSPPKYVWGVSYTPGSVIERLARATTAAALRALAQEAPSYRSASSP